MCRWGLTRFVIQATEMTPGLRERLPPTDSRLRRDLQFLERARYEEVCLTSLHCIQQGLSPTPWKQDWQGNRTPETV